MENAKISMNALMMKTTIAARTRTAQMRKAVFLVSVEMDIAVMA